MSKIRVDLDDLVAKLKSMIRDDFSVVELIIDDESCYGDYTLKLKAIDISDEEDTEYGEIPSLSDEYII